MIAESEYINVGNRASELGCHVPDSLAIMPENFHSAHSRNELVVRAESATLRELFDGNGTPLGSFFPLGEHPTFGHDPDISWEAALFVPAGIHRTAPHAVTQAMVTISNHLKGFFGGRAAKPVRLRIVVERKANRSCKKLVYTGDAAGIAALAGAVSSAADER